MSKPNLREAFKPHPPESCLRSCLNNIDEAQNEYRKACERFNAIPEHEHAIRADRLANEKAGKKPEKLSSMQAHLRDLEYECRRWKDNLAHWKRDAEYWRARVPRETREYIDTRLPREPGDDDLNASDLPF